MKPMMKSSLPVLALSAVLFAPGGAARADATADAVRVIQQGWERITYQLAVQLHQPPPRSCHCGLSNDPFSRSGVGPAGR